MKMPNGYGSVFKLSGKRRKPWVARKTIGWKEIENKERGYPIYQVIGYFEKREQALEALIDFNKNPYDINISKITFSEVYEKWSDKKFLQISDSNVKGYKASYLLCDSISEMNFIDIKLNHLQDIVDNSGKNYPTLRKLKVLLNQMYDYAVKHEIIAKERNLVEYVDISGAGNPNALDRKPFTKKQVVTIWKWATGNDYFKIILMLIYNGVRISEFLDLKKENVNLKEKWFDVINSKTEAGIRKVPISDKTLEFYNYWYCKNDCEYLLSTPEGNHFEYRNYYDSYWKPLIDQIGMDHTPHCTRYTCISFLTAAGVDERIIQKIVGHKGIGVTQRVYTKLEIEELIIAINKM